MFHGGYPSVTRYRWLFLALIFLRNTRKMDSLRRLEDRVFLAHLVAWTAPFALLRNSLAQRSSAGRKMREFLAGWWAAPALCELSRHQYQLH